MPVIHDPSTWIGSVQHAAGKKEWDALPIWARIKFSEMEARLKVLEEDWYAARTTK